MHEVGLKSFLMLLNRRFVYIGGPKWQPGTKLMIIVRVRIPPVGAVRGNRIGEGLSKKWRRVDVGEVVFMEAKAEWIGVR